MKPPVIYFAYANDEKEHLNCLKEESSNLMDVLEDADDKGWLKVKREESVEINDVEKLLTKEYNDDRIIIFQ